ncbi:MAG: caspase family protein [Candidatus Hadarchaeales archaeon]
MKGAIRLMACAAAVLCVMAIIGSSAAGMDVSGGMRVYRGPKEIYEEKGSFDSAVIGAKAKPKPPSGPQPDPSVDKWAVVIGISDYRGRQYDLQYCDDDARDMYNYLLSRGYPAGNIKLLLDGNATAKNIMAALDWLNSWEGPNSEVVIFYSGHGSTYDGYNDGDAEYTDEAIVSSDLYLILDGQLRQKLSTFSSKKITLIFDSCFSGGMDDLNGNGRVVVAACGETEYSYDGTSAQQNGVFTYYFVGSETAGLQTYNVVESAFAYAAPLAHDFVASQYGGNMNPVMYDMYSGDWCF